MRRTHSLLALCALIPTAALTLTAPAGAAPAQRGSGPVARSSFSMANDAARGTVVLFGGWDGTAPLGDTWTWGGTSWTEQHPATSPGPRFDASMAYDAARGQVVLFGGTDISTYFSDTWTWDGANWTEQSPATSPDLSCCASMAFDASTRKIVLSSFFETWTWDGANWTNEQPGNSPSWRETPGMSREGGNVLLFGGDDGFEDFNAYDDTWRWDGTNWNELAVGWHPAKRTEMGIGYDLSRGQVVLFGGAGSDFVRFFADTWIWNGNSWGRRHPPTSPPGRALMGFAYDSTRHQVVLFGGRAVVQGEYQYFADTWTWDGSTWTEH